MTEAGKRQFWTESDLDYLRANYKRMPVEQLAKRLKRSVRSLYNTAKKYGFASQRMVVPGSAIRAMIRKKHPQGWTDPEIAAELYVVTGHKVDRHRVSGMRRAMNLPSNKASSHRREQVRQRTKRQLEKANLPTLASARVERFNQWKRDLGWPEHLTVRAVQALEMFYQHGPMTRAQLCVLMGVSSKKRTAPVSRAKGGTVLAELVNAGLISRVAKAVEVPFDLKLHDDPIGSGRPRTTNRRIRTKHVSMYFLNPGVEPNGKRKQRSASDIAARQADGGDRKGHARVASSDARRRGQLDKRGRRKSDRSKAGRKGKGRKRVRG